MMAISIPIMCGPRDVLPKLFANTINLKQYRDPESPRPGLLHRRS